jgi:glutathione S-transferase
MAGAMKLYWSSRSPFVRKVVVFAHEVGLADRIERVRMVVGPTTPNAEVMGQNPLNKLPTLMTAEHGAIYDSRVICDYLDTLHKGPKLIPASGAERTTALRRQAFADGVMDFMLLWLNERTRPPERQSTEHLAAYRFKFALCFDALERDAEALGRTPVGIGQIATACACSYADFRFEGEEWRKERPQLAAWHAEFAKRPSMQATEHADVY